MESFVSTLGFLQYPFIYLSKVMPLARLSTTLFARDFVRLAEYHITRMLCYKNFASIALNQSLQPRSHMPPRPSII